MATVDPTHTDIANLKIRIGTVRRARIHEAARNPMYIVDADFGPDGVKITCARLTQAYPDPQSLVGRQIVGLLSVLPKKVAGVSSEFLMLAGVAANGSVVLVPDVPVANGTAVA